ncbi:MAG: transcriptional regulator [Candidatus Pacearchaeota archaeon]
MKKINNCLTQRIELNYIIPAIRKKLVNLLEKQGLKDAEIAKKLKITKAAISQYKHKKRGKSIKFPKSVEKEIEKAAKIIKKGKNANAEISKIINKIKASSYICIICKECKK